MRTEEAARSAKAEGPKRLAALLLKWAITYQMALTMDDANWIELARADMA